LSGSTKVAEVNGWEIHFHPEFAQQYADLTSDVGKIKSGLPHDRYIRHSTVKLRAHLIDVVFQKIPDDPMASHFALRGKLKRMSRAKKMGLPSRYRLFFKVFPESKQIVILWLGFPRKDGAKDDCYEVFTKRLEAGYYPQSFDELIEDT
jgi:toxin YhaV